MRNHTCIEPGLEVAVMMERHFCGPRKPHGYVLSERTINDFPSALNNGDLPEVADQTPAECRKELWNLGQTSAP